MDSEILCRHTGSMLEITIKRSWFVKSRHVGNFFKRSRRIGLNKPFCLRDDILLNPLCGRHASHGTDRRREILGREMKQGAEVRLQIALIHLYFCDADDETFGLTALLLDVRCFFIRSMFVWMTCGATYG